MNGIIYMYTSPSGKSYIGQTWHESARKREHRLNRSGCGGALLHKAMRKYGYENILYCVLHKNIEEQSELDRLEIEEIKNKNTMAPNGYNLSSGGAKGCCFSEESKKKISAALMGHEVSEEAREKIRLKLIGKNYVSSEKRREGFAKKEWRPPSGAKLACLKRARETPRSEQSRAASIKALTDYVLTDEDRKKRRERTLGEKNPFYGKKHTEETKRKISETKRRNKK